MAFQKATKAQSKGRVALLGPSGAGKTYTALRLAKGLGGRIAVIDTERGSASKYADEFEFDVCELETFSPQAYIAAIREAEVAGYDVLIIDSLSHAWMGKGGVLEIHDAAVKRSRSGNSFDAWREVTPQHNALVDALVQSKCHVIATMRTKTEYVVEEDERGKKVPRKVGMAPIQRDGLEYEFDVVGDLNQSHEWVISKSRCKALADQIITKPGEETAEVLRAWLSDGAPAPERPAASVGEAMECEELREQIRSLAQSLRMTRGLDDKLAAIGNDPAALREALAKLANLDAQRSGTGAQSA